jgi:hypothetical protein
MGFSWPSRLINRNSEKSVHTNFTKTVYVLPNHLPHSLKVFDHLEKFGKVLIFSIRPFAASWYRSLSLSMSWNWNIFTGTNTFKHAEFESENCPRRKPAVLPQNAILSSLISQQIFSLFNDTDRWRHTIISLKTINFY